MLYSVLFIYPVFFFPIFMEIQQLLVSVMTQHPQLVMGNRPQQQRLHPLQLAIQQRPQQQGPHPLQLAM